MRQIWSTTIAQHSPIFDRIDSHSIELVRLVELFARDGEIAIKIQLRAKS